MHFHTNNMGVCGLNLNYCMTHSSNFPERDIIINVEWWLLMITYQPTDLEVRTWK